MTNRNIYLYIDGQLADITSDTLVLFNYAASDLSNPAAVKNSYSQQATLPATAANDRIFAAIYRADWRARLDDASFNPLIRTPFAIYDDTGAILESGYLKLNTVKNKNGVRSYAVTLYGGLGSFFYTLAYDAEGEAMTLGDLPLLGDDPTQQIDFRINAEAVAEAWDRLLGLAADRQFDVVNFAPAYNGLPAGEFDASKGVGNPRSVGGDAWKTDDKGDTFTTYGPNNDALYDFGDDFTEWQMHDLRSYMQRPVVSVKALFEGIVRYATTKGFTVHLDPAWFSDANRYYTKAWMTLPLLAGRSVPTVEEQTINISGFDLSGSGEADTYGTLAVPLNPSISVPNVDVTVRCTPAVVFDKSSMVESSVWLTCQPIQGTNLQNLIIGSIFFVQVQLLDAKGNILASSAIQVGAGGKLYHGDRYAPTAQQLVDAAGLPKIFRDQKSINPTIHTGSASLRSFDTSAGMVRHYVFSAFEEVEVTAYNAASARIVVEPRQFYWTMDPAPTPHVAKRQLYVSNAPQAPGTLYNITRWGGITMGPATLEYAYPSEEYRSGVRVTQKALFADTMSPMEFLLSYTKTFGLHYLYDQGRRHVEILTRNTLYGNRKTVDLQQRIDRSREITTTPIPMSAKWLEFAPESIEGEFAEYYKAKYGREYGIQKVNTGFDFDANTTQALDGAKFNGGPEVLERSKYFLYVKNKDRSNVPAPTVDGKTTYKLYRTDEKGDRQSIDLDYPNMTLAINGFEGFRYFNANKGYDGVPKLQCHGDDNDGTDGAGILLFHRGLASEDPATVGDAVARRAYDGFRISDDSPAMYDLAGKPCWELSDGESAIHMPAFGRFDMAGTTVQRSMEPGTPAEIDNPVIAVGRYASIYERYWADYITDRYDVDTRTCTAYVDLRGLQPGPEMLRDFYYFDGALWVLNKIANYSLSTPGTTQCEFVRVQEQARYTGGQVYTVEGKEYGEWVYSPDNTTRSRLVRPYVQDVFPDGTLGERIYDRAYTQTQTGQHSVDWDGEAYWNGSCGADYYYVDYRKVRDKYTYSDVVRYSDYRNGESRSRRIDGQCGWERAWRATGDWYRTGGTCNAIGVNGAYDCDGTYSVTYWNEGQDQSYCYPDMSGSTQTRTIWRVGPVAVREQVEGQCGYTPRAPQLDVGSYTWESGLSDHDADSTYRSDDGVLHIVTQRNYTDGKSSVLLQLNNIELVASDGSRNPITANSLTIAKNGLPVTLNCDFSAVQSGIVHIKITFVARMLMMVSSWDGQILITHKTTGAEILLDIRVSFGAKNSQITSLAAEEAEETVDIVPADDESAPEETGVPKLFPNPKTDY